MPPHIWMALFFEGLICFLDTNKLGNYISNFLMGSEKRIMGCLESWGRLVAEPRCQDSQAVTVLYFR